MQQKGISVMKKNYMGLGIAIGVGLGVAVGAALGEIATWTALGAGIGVAIGAGLNWRTKRKNKSNDG